MPDAETRICEGCDGEFSLQFMTGSLCEGCSYRCQECDFRTDDDALLDSYDRCEDCSRTCSVCDDCVEYHDAWNRGMECCSTSCESCGDIFNTNYASDTICDGCLANNSNIQEWDYVPAIRFFHTIRTPVSRQPRSGLYMGIEVEVECGDDSPKDIAGDLAFSSTDPWYIKSDGSLDNGIEVVSHPIEIERWRTCNDMGWMRDAINMGCRSYGTDTCGLHVHISRTQFTKLHLWKILTLLAKNYEWTERIGRRKTISAYAYLDKLEDFIDASYIIDKAISNVRGIRYSSVNMSNSETVEFRLFRGTLSKSGLLRNIDWLACLVGYTRSVSIPALSLDSFHAWIRSSKSERYISRISAGVIANWSEENMQCV